MSLGSRVERLETTAGFSGKTHLILCRPDDSMEALEANYRTKNEVGEEDLLVKVQFVRPSNTKGARQATESTRRL